MLLVITMLFVAGCQGGESIEPESDSGEGSGVSIVHWQHHSDARAAVVKDLVKDFQESQSGVSVEFESIPYSSYFEKIGPSLEAGRGPCVFQLPSNIVYEFYTRGQLAPVPQNVMSGPEIESTFVNWATSLLKIKGEYYGLPTDVQTFLLFYNDALFEEAGLDPSKDFETWGEFRDAAKALTKVEDGVMAQAGVDITGSPYQWYWGLPMQVFTEGLVDPEALQVTYDSSPGYAMWKSITDLVLADEVDSREFLSEQDKFAVGKAGMTLREYTFTGVFKITAPEVKFSVHPAPPPDGAEDPNAVGGTAWSYVVSSECENPKEAWEWVQFITSEEAQRKWVSEGGELPSRASLVEDESLRSDPNAAMGLDSLQHAKAFDSFGWDDVFAIHQQIWDSIVLDGASVTSAVDKGAADEEALYKKKELAPGQ